MKQYPITAQPKNEIVVYQPNETMQLEVELHDLAKKGKDIVDLRSGSAAPPSKTPAAACSPSSRCRPSPTSF